MRRSRRVLAALGLGAGLMYLLDPAQGRRRRALLADRMTHARRKLDDAWGKTRRDVEHRVEGVRARVGALGEGDDADDRTVGARVRTRVGRAVSHPGSVESRVEDGVVVLEGPVFQDEAPGLVRQVRRVKGVRAVEDRLERHLTADGVPGLQGEGRRPARRPEVLQDHWSPATRVAAGTVGGAAAAWGLSRGGVRGSLAALAGSAALARALTNLPISAVTGWGERRRAITVQKDISIAADPDTVYKFWNSYEDFPTYMSHVREVTPEADGRSHWVVEGPFGIPVSWEAQVTRAEPGRMLAWRSEPGTGIANTGVVRFEPSDGHTRVDVKLQYRPPAGVIGHAVAKVLGVDPKRALDDDLLRLKTLIETGNPPHDARPREEAEEPPPPPADGPGV